MKSDDVKQHVEITECLTYFPFSLLFICCDRPIGFAFTNTNARISLRTIAGAFVHSTLFYRNV